MKKIERKTGVFGDSIDYAFYDMSFSEKLIGFLVGYMIGVIAVQIFFDSLPVSLILGIAAGIAGIRVFNMRKRENRDVTLRVQFKDMLEALTTSYESGKNSTDAFEAAYQDMITQYGEEAYITRELRTIVMAVKNNINIEDVLRDFAARSNNEDIESFADVFSVASWAGGNMQHVIANTKNIITDKINIELEIETLVSGKKNELNIMIVLPFIVVSQIKGFSETTDGSLSTVLISIGTRILALAIFTAAYVVGQKMIKIKV